MALTSLIIMLSVEDVAVVDDPFEVVMSEGEQGEPFEAFES